MLLSQWWEATVTLGDVIPEHEFVHISENYHLVPTGDGEWHDA
jgi:hypothetical protein